MVDQERVRDPIRRASSPSSASSAPSPHDPPVPDSGVAFVPLVGDVAEVVLAWRGGQQVPSLAPFAAVVREVARELDPVAAG